MGDIDPDQLVDSIYEAAILPENWPGVLHNLARFADGVGCLVGFYSPTFQGGARSSGVEPLYEQYLSGWHERNTRLPRLLAARHPGFIREDDVFAPGEWEKDDNFNHLLKPLGLGWAAATAIFTPSGDSIALTVERAWKKGPVERETIARLDALRPHLARASILTARLGLEKARAAAEALGEIGLPAAVISTRRTLLAANQSFAEMIPQTFMDRRDRLVLANRRADALLLEAFHRLAERKWSTSPSSRVQSIPVPATGPEPPMVLHLVAICGYARDVFSNILGLLIVTRAVGATPQADLVEALFDLTPAEARVAARISRGETVSEIAASSELSPHTVRSQVKSVLAKTGAARQTDLVRLLSGVGLGVKPR